MKALKKLLEKIFENVWGTAVVLFFLVPLAAFSADDRTVFWLLWIHFLIISLGEFIESILKKRKEM